MTAEPMGEPVAIEDAQILHVVVGCGLPVMFMNAVTSFRSVCPTAELLVVDNDSPQPRLRSELAQRAEGDPHMEVLLRSDNDPANPKTGGLHDAYRAAFTIAFGRGFDYVHLLHGDMQVMWWDADARHKLADIYRRHPRCVNVSTRAQPKDRYLMADVVVDPGTDEATVAGYGMTDVGVFHLARWRKFGMEFCGTEEKTSARALELGLEVVVTPWPTEIPVPWPAVMRRGRQVGREVLTTKPFLCRPLDAAAVAAVKASRRPVAWETLCVPWGWSCLSPMSATDLGTWYYFNYRRHDIRRNGWREGRPRLVTAGLDHRFDVVTTPHRPPVVPFLLRPVPSLLGELARRISARRPGIRAGRAGRQGAGRGLA